MVKKFILPILGFLLMGMFLISVSAINISNCTNLDTPGETYSLNQSINGLPSQTCFEITADNVTLDCQGHTITGDAYGLSKGLVATDVDNIKIQNCNFYKFDYAIRYKGVSYSEFSNNTLEGGKEAMYLTGYSHNNIFENNLITYFNTGITGYTTYNNTFSNNELNQNSVGIQFSEANTQQELYDNDFCENKVDIYNKNTITGSNNTCDVTILYNDTGATGCANTCDVEYTINGSVCTVTKDSCATFHKAVQNPACKEIKLATDIFSGAVAGTCVNAGGSSTAGKTIDCQGHSITGVYNKEGAWDQSNGIRLYSSVGDMTIQNCDISGFYRGIDLSYPTNMHIINNTLHDNVEGLYNYRSIGSKVYNNTFYSNSYDDFTGSIQLLSLVENNVCGIGGAETTYCCYIVKDTILTNDVNCQILKVYDSRTLTTDGYSIKIGEKGMSIEGSLAMENGSLQGINGSWKINLDNANSYNFQDVEIKDGLNIGTKIINGTNAFNKGNNTLTSLWDFCGNGVLDVDFGETCDVSDFGTKTCGSGFTGSLSCNSSCSIDYGGCTAIPSVNSGGGYINYYSCNNWSEWTTCVEGTQTRECLEVTRSSEKDSGVLFLEFEEVQTQDCEVEIIPNIETELINVEEVPARAGFFARTTGAVVGFSESGTGLIMFIIIGALILAYLAFFFVRKFRKKKVKKNKKKK